MHIPGQNIPPVFILAGLTGSGKTALIQYLKRIGAQALDIEWMCRHDGSVFAKLQYPSHTSSYQFHKQLTKQWNLFDKSKPVFIESELKKIGSITLPDWLYNIMKNAPVIWLDISRDKRIERIASIIRQSNPIIFLNCLSKLNTNLGKDKWELAMQHFQYGDMEQLTGILIGYYDNARGYSYPEHRVILRLPVTNIDVKLIADTIINEANSRCGPIELSGGAPY